MNTHDAPTNAEGPEALKARLDLLAEINSDPGDRERLEREHGQVWNPDELRRDFEVLSFAAPLVVARRRSDQKLGSLEFQHHPRFYFSWREDKP